MPDGQSLAQIELIDGNAHFNWNLMARLRPGVTLAQASTVADAEFQDVLVGVLMIACANVESMLLVRAAARRRELAARRYVCTGRMA